ncbi:hypothetical protein VNO80_33066 [Phaseolus coccineus]|uniref:Uncharacterized protein n=1 Tax=Phaseolus coccineus TaxID=3886 RepID=A0AAN9KZM6_PHACN
MPSLLSLYPRLDWGEFSERGEDSVAVKRINSISSRARSSMSRLRRVRLSHLSTLLIPALKAATYSIAHKLSRVRSFIVSKIPSYRIVVNVLLSVSPEMGIIALSNKGRAYFRRKAEDFALAQASPDRDRYEVAVPIGAAGEGKKEKDYRLINVNRKEEIPPPISGRVFHQAFRYHNCPIDKQDSGDTGRADNFEGLASVCNSLSRSIRANSDIPSTTSDPVPVYSFPVGVASRFSWPFPFHV